MFHVYEIEAWVNLMQYSFLAENFYFYLFFFLLKAVDINWDSLKTPFVLFLEIFSLCHFLHH